MKKFLVSALVVSLIAIGGMAMGFRVKQDQNDPFKIAQMMEEIREARRVKIDATVHVEDIILKYIPLGSDQDQIISALKAYGMGIRDVHNDRFYSAKDNKKYTARFNAHTYLWVLKVIPVPYLFSMSIDFKDKKLVRVFSAFYDQVMP